MDTAYDNIPKDSRESMYLSATDREWLRREILSSGAVAVGFAVAEVVDDEVMGQYRKWIESGNHAGMEYLNRHIVLKSDPAFVLPGASTVISVAFSYAPKKFRDESLPAIACYAYGDDYHHVIKKRLIPVVSHLKDRFGGEWRICIDSAPLAERYWALKSGIGIRGYNGSVIVDGAGGYAFLAEIVTTVAISPDGPSKDECKKCGACQKACPQKALYIDGSVDSRRCLNYLTIEHRGEWQEDLADNMQTSAARNTLYGCDRCLRVCPYNREVIPTAIPEFEPREQIMSLSAEEVFTLTQEEFSTLFKGSPIKRAKLAGLQRNAINVINGQSRNCEDTFSGINQITLTGSSKGHGSQ